MGYVQERKVIEDMVVSDTSPGGKKIFTGGASELELPFTISFKSEGDYTVHISKGNVTVNKVEKADKPSISKYV